MSREPVYNYDRTAAKRMRNRSERIRESGLSDLKVVMYKADAEEIRAFAKKLYKKRGLELIE